MQPANEDYRFVPGRNRWIGAAVLIVLGVLFLLDNLNILPFDEVWRFWPIALIALGVFLLVDRTVWRFNFPRYGRDEYLGASSGGYRIRETAVFGGGKRRINSQSFTGGKIDAVMGGFQIDLRDANMLGDVATLDVAAVPN